MTDDEGYDGPAELLTELLTDGEPDAVAVTVRVRGFFQPIDGRYHWYGRVAQHDRLDAVLNAGGAVVLRTPHGQAAGRLSDRDPWGRYRIGGTSRPPWMSATSSD